MKKRSFLFLINYYNDVDHTTPLVRELLCHGHSVSIICLTAYNLESDIRISHLRSYDNFRVHRLHLLPRNKGVSNQNTGSITFFKKIYREILFNKMTAMLFLAVHRIDKIIVTWSRPRAKGLQRRIFQGALFLRVPTICIPHGQNIYLNYDVNNYLREQYSHNGKWPDFSARNEFSYYVVQTERHRKQHIDWGMLPSKVVTLGSLRFDPKWIATNIGLYPKQTILDDLGKADHLKILFFLPHWRYNVDTSLTFELMNAIASIPRTLLVIKGHTRGDAVDEERSNQLSTKSNVVVNCELESPQLSQWADIVINFGSSIAIESIFLGKHVIYTPFLHTNTTIFDKSGAVHSADGIGHVVNIIQNIQSGLLKPPTRSSIEQLLKSEVYTDINPHDVATRYMNFLTNE